MNCTKSNVTVRSAVASDSPAILMCLASAFEPYRDEYTHEAYADTVLDRQSVQDRLREMSVLVAVCGDQVVGTVAFSVEGDTAHLRGMAVRQEWQGVGVASALLHNVVAALRQRNCRFVTLDTTEPLERAINFYRRAGFAPSSKISDFFGMRLHEYVRSL
jgi:ribosomal protein S18 acetylase RimI-like enzyme